MFYAALKRVCEKLGTSPCAVAIGIGMSKSAVTRWKNGQSPSLDTVMEIASYLSIAPLELFSEICSSETVME